MTGKTDMERLLEYLKEEEGYTDQDIYLIGEALSLPPGTPWREHVPLVFTIRIGEDKAYATAWTYYDDAAHAADCSVAHPSKYPPKRNVVVRTIYRSLPVKPNAETAGNLEREMISWARMISEEVFEHDSDVATHLSLGYTVMATQQTPELVWTRLYKVV